MFWVCPTLPHLDAGTYTKFLFRLQFGVLPALVPNTKLRAFYTLLFICFFIYLFIYLCIYLFVYLFICCYYYCYSFYIVGSLIGLIRSGMINMSKNKKDAFKLNVYSAVSIL